MTIIGMAPARCFLHWMWQREKSSGKARRRHQEFLAFLRHIGKNGLRELDVHLVIDNYATHKHPKVRAWPAQRSRYYAHFATAYNSWLNQVERWFKLLTQRATAQLLQNRQGPDSQD